MQLVSSAENSSLDWRAQYSYIEDIGDGRGYTAGIIGFCSGTGDMLEVVQAYTAAKPDNVLAGTCRRCGGSTAPTRTPGSAGLPARLAAAARRPVFQDAQEPSATASTSTRRSQQAKHDGLRALGQFAYYDAAVMHGYEGMRASAAARSPRRHAGRGRRRDHLAERVPRRARDRDEEGGGPRHARGRHRAARVPAHRQLRPQRRRCAEGASGGRSRTSTSRTAPSAQGCTMPGRDGVAADRRRAGARRRAPRTTSRRGRAAAGGGSGGCPATPRASAVEPDRAQGVDEHGDLDAVADRERQRLQQRPAGRRLARQRLLEPGQRRDVEVQQRAGHQLGDAAALAGVTTPPCAWAAKVPLTSCTSGRQQRAEQAEQVDGRGVARCRRPGRRRCRRRWPPPRATSRRPCRAPARARAATRPRRRPARRRRAARAAVAVGGAPSTTSTSSTTPARAAAATRLEHAGDRVGAVAGGTTTDTVRRPCARAARRGRRRGRRGAGDAATRRAPGRAKPARRAAAGARRGRHADVAAAAQGHAGRAQPPGEGLVLQRGSASSPPTAR